MNKRSARLSRWPNQGVEALRLPPLGLERFSCWSDSSTLSRAARRAGQHRGELPASRDCLSRFRKRNIALSGD
jgi:hypothetical protein